MKKKCIKAVAVILSIALFVQIMPVVAVEPSFAKLTSEQAAKAATGDTYAAKNRIEEPVAILAEDETLRSEFAKYYRNVDGSYTIAMYPEPVHFKDVNGQWQDIDNSLALNDSKYSSAGQATYTPVASGLDIQIPQDFANDQKLTIGKDGYTVGLGVIAPQSSMQPEPVIPDDGGEPPVTEEVTTVPVVGEPTTEEVTTVAPPNEDITAVAEDATTVPVIEETTAPAEVPPTTEPATPAPPIEGTPVAPNNQPDSVEPSEETVSGLSAAKAEVNNDLAARSSEQGEPATQTKAEKVQAANTEKMDCVKLTSSVIYRDIFPCADLEYIVSPSKIKENIWIKEAQAEYIYQFNLSLGGLISMPQEDGSIYLLKNIEDTEPLFILQAPYMYDAAGVSSTALKMDLTADGTLTLTADAAWVNAEGREFPVCIDPTLVASTKTGIQDTHVSSSQPSTNFGSAQDLIIGYLTIGITSYTARAYIRFDLPDLPDGSIVYNATLLLNQNMAIGVNPNQLVAYDCTNKATWDANTLKWNNQPFSTAINGNTNETALDYFNTINTLSAGYIYYWDITKAAKNWYENNGTNNGIMLATRNESAGPAMDCASADSSTVANRPAVLISYTNNTGLESYWDYEAVDHGRFGTAYVNDYNGELTYVLNDISLSGRKNPLNISHVYNSSRENRQYLPPNMKMGTGFRLNLSEQIVPVPAGDLYNLGYHYKLIDADGTVHYFKLYQSGCYVTEGQEWFLSIGDMNSLYPFQMNSLTSDEDKWYNADGYLAAMYDGRYGRQYITWVNGRITQVSDGANRIATFGYDNNDFLTSITDPAGRVTSIFYYPDGTLWGIWYPDVKSTGFGYDINGNLNQVAIYDGAESAATLIDYKDVVCFGKTFYRVNQITQYSKNITSVANQLNFSYLPGMTRVTNQYGKYNEYIFDNAGRTVNVRNQDGQTAFALYHSANDSNVALDALANKPSMTSTTQTVVINLIKNHGFENGLTHWDDDYDGSGIVSVSTVEKRRGQKSLKLASSDYMSSARVSQEFDGQPGQTYTISADVLIPQALQARYGVQLGFEHMMSGYSGGGNPPALVTQPTLFTQPISSSVTNATNGWERISHTYTLPTDVTAPFYAILWLNQAEGEVYIDNVQVEKSDGANPYNLMENSDFADSPGITPVNWTMTNSESGDGRVVENGRNVVTMAGSPTLQKKITQRVQVNAQAGETIIFGGVAKSTSVGFDGDYRKFSIVADIYNASGQKIVSLSPEAPFKRDVHDLQQMTAAAYTVPANTTAAYVDYSFVYYNQLNEVRFYDAFVYVGNFATDFEYQGGAYGFSSFLTKLKNDAGKEVTIAYNNNNMPTTITEKQDGQTLSTTQIEYYPSSRRIKSVTDSSGIKTEYTYGQVESTTITSEDETLSTTESIEYTTDGNYVASYTDARGGTSSYTYNLVKGLKLSATDPEGNTVSYTYDPNSDELLSVTGEADPLMPVSTGFGYQGGYVMQNISHNNMQYFYNYDDLNRVTEAKVGNQTLVENEYNIKQQLESQTYAPGTIYETVYEPMYDSRDRFAGEKWNDTQTSAYAYNDYNQLSRAVDNITHIAYQYNYDLSGRMESVLGDDGSSTKIAYDAKSAPNRLTFGQEGVTIFDAEYASDDQGKVTGATIYSLAGAALAYTYDGLNRPTGRTLTTPNLTLTDSVTYLPGQNGSTTGLVSQHNYNIYNYDFGNLQPILQSVNISNDYTYDANGNIETISEGGIQQVAYTYDGLNRLASEDCGYRTLGYTYDEGGNLISVTQDNVTLHEYDYDNPNWTDQLTAFDGKAITYDLLGNPLTYDGYTYTWDKGRQLAGITGNGKTIAYTYDASGRRTSKTVNGVTTTYTYSGSLLMRQSDGTDTLDFQYDASGTAVGFKYNGEPYFYRRNLQGDVTCILNKWGEFIGRYQYDNAWGKIGFMEIGNDPYGGSFSNFIRILEANPIRYRGYYYDNETGWYWLQTRYYNPTWCRFINADSLFIAGEDVINGSNMYAYCNGNPVMGVDPTGMAYNFWPAGYQDFWAAFINLFTYLLTTADYKRVPGGANSPNCYGYVVGLSYRCNPGGAFDPNHSYGRDTLYDVDMIAQWVINDYRSIGITAKIIDFDYKNPPTLAAGSYIISLRCIAAGKASYNQGNDYHFMRMHSNGMWSEKHGTNSSTLHRLIKNPEWLWTISLLNIKYKSKTVYILVNA